MFQQPTTRLQEHSPYVKQELVFFTEGGKHTLHKLNDLVQAKKIKGIVRHGSFPAGVCPTVLTPQGLDEILLHFF